MAHSNQTQCDRLVEWLCSGRTITPLDVVSPAKIGTIIVQLPARIKDIRDVVGHHLVPKQMQELAPDETGGIVGKKVARYYVEREDRETVRRLWREHVMAKEERRRVLLGHPSPHTPEVA